MKKAVLLLPEANRDRIFTRQQLEEAAKLVELRDCCHLTGRLDDLRLWLADVQVILSGWGMMRMDKAFLDAAPRLEAVFYAAGTVRGFVTEEFWRRGILLTSTWASNAKPVVEFTVAAIVFGMKKALQCAALTRQTRSWKLADGIRGLYGAKVGVVGAGMVGQGVLKMLQSYEVQTFYYDPFVPPERVASLGARPMELSEMFSTCDVVTVHAASLPSTRHMIRGEHLRLMKPGAMFINTARGAIVKEDEMVDVLREGRIFAFIDVTDPEPPSPESPLFDLPNVFLTPHLAGAQGDEVHRNGEYALEELRRFVRGEPPLYPVTRDMMEWMA